MSSSLCEFPGSLKQQKRDVSIKSTFNAADICYFRGVIFCGLNSKVFSLVYHGYKL